MKTLKKTNSSKFLKREENKSGRLFDTVEIEEDTVDGGAGAGGAGAGGAGSFRSKIFDHGEDFEGGYNAIGHDDEWEEIHKEIHTKKQHKLSDKEFQEGCDFENGEHSSDGDSDAPSISSVETDADY